MSEIPALALAAPEDAEAEPSNRAAHLFLATCVAACVSFLVWAAFGKLGVVSLANGEVIPSSQVKTVQHLEGGIVREIRVREGDTVKASQSLIVLESTASGADVIELKARLTGLQVQIARLRAEAEGAESPTFLPDVVARNPKLVREAQNLFDSRRARLKNEVASRTELITQRGQDIREISSRIKNLRTSLKLLNEQITISEELLKDDLTNRYNHLNLLKERSGIVGQIDSDRVALERADSIRKQALNERQRVRNVYDQEVRTELDRAQRDVSEFTPRLAKFEDSLKRTVLRSPVDGVVKTLHVVTIGGVLRAGDPVVDIVPGEDRLVIEAKLATQDIGFVQAGQKALIKLASSDAMRFDNLEGTVLNVSPDTLVSEDGVPFYKVRIETERDHFRRGPQKYNLFPGMQVSTSIHTGERTVLEYILDPFLDSMGSAMRER